MTECVHILLKNKFLYTSRIKTPSHHLKVNQSIMDVIMSDSSSSSSTIIRASDLEGEINYKLDDNLIYKHRATGYTYVFIDAFDNIKRMDGDFMSINVVRDKDDPSSATITFKKVDGDECFETSIMFFDKMIKYMDIVNPSFITTYESRDFKTNDGSIIIDSAYMVYAKAWSNVNKQKRRRH